VKFKVNYLKVHEGWAWINVVPLDPKGKLEGEEWPSLLQNAKGQWKIIDLMAIARALDDPVGRWNRVRSFGARCRSGIRAFPAIFFRVPEPRTQSDLRLPTSDPDGPHGRGYREEN
jgi:hypothetical protein